jgi:hypothetical protein
VNGDDVIRGITRLGSVEVKVQCPKGKGRFVDNVTLCVRDGQLTMRSGHSKNDVRRRQKQNGGVLHADVHMKPDGNVELPCRKPGCKYRLYRNGLELALELAGHALRQPDPRHAAYRLKS